ncbi:MAG: hypothetical protein LBI56_03355 [Puniceicoccales bacterium]|nr:hypothetical protein [Puniceicoccales bacterium]
MKKLHGKETSSRKALTFHFAERRECGGAGALLLPAGGIIDFHRSGCGKDQRVGRALVSSELCMQIFGPTTLFF